MGIIAHIADMLASWRSDRGVTFALLFKKFKSILVRNNRILELMADMGDKLGGEYIFDRKYIEDACASLDDQVFKLISDMSVLTQRKNTALFLAFEHIQHHLQEEIAGRRHELLPGARIVVITGFATLDTAKESFRKGAFDFVAKPFKLGGIIDCVRRIEAEMNAGGRAAVTPHEPPHF